MKINRLSLAPGERAELIVEVKIDGVLALKSYPHPLGQGMMGMMRRGMDGMRRMMMGGNEVLNDNQQFDLLEIRPSSGLKGSSPLPHKLSKFQILQETDAVRTRRFTLQMGMGPGMMMGRGRGHGNGNGNGMSINGQSMDPNRIDETVRLGDTEIWEIVNMSPLPHPFHIHDIQFQILDRNGRPPHPSEMGLKDTVTVGHMEKVRVIAKFEDFADPDTPYMYHCHILEHEDGGMMGQFIVRS